MRDASMATFSFFFYSVELYLPGQLPIEIVGFLCHINSPSDIKNHAKHLALPVAHYEKPTCKVTNPNPTPTDPRFMPTDDHHHRHHHRHLGLDLSRHLWDVLRDGHHGTRHARPRLDHRVGRGCHVCFALVFLLRDRLSRRGLGGI